MAPEVIRDIPLDKFHADQRVRSEVNQELVEQIARSFKTVGQLQPVRVRAVEDLFWMVDGHHRLAAAHLAGWNTLAAITEQKALADGHVIQRQLIANCLRESLSHLEEARAIQQLIEVTGCNASQAAAAIGFSNATVTRRLMLLTLPPTILEQVASGKISASAAYELHGIADPEKQAELAAQLADGRLTRDGVSGARKAAKRSTNKTEGHAARVTAILGENRTITVSSAGLTLERFIEQIEELLGKARRVRSQGLELGTFIKMLRDQARCA